MISYTIYIPISSTTRGLLVLIVFSEFDFVSQIMRVEEDLEALWINVASKIGPKLPNTCKPCQIPRSRTMHETQ